MKRILLFCLVALLVCSGCKPQDETQDTIGTEDGGGLGYGITAKSILRLSDFYFIRRSSARETNLLVLGTPVYSFGNDDTYQLEDKSQIVLSYDKKGVLLDAAYMEFATGNNYSLFELLQSLGIVNSVQTPTTDTPATDDKPTENQGGALPMFSSKDYTREEFETLSLFTARNTVLATYGSPSYFVGRDYQKDSYIIDCYLLKDGAMLLIDYGYSRTSLRCAAIKEADGTVEALLGNWTKETKPADLVRARVEEGLVSKLRKKMKPEQVYAVLGEPLWYQGNSSNYQEVYMLSDGSSLYLTYDNGHNALSDVIELKADGTALQVALR